MSDTDTQYNPYASDGGSPNTETLALDSVIRQAISAALLNVHTCLPAQVTKVIGNNQVNVVPMLKRKYVNGQIVMLPQIQNVPVYVPRGTEWWFKCPVAVGDTGFIQMSERSLDRWKVSGGILDPQDNRKFDLTDAIFLPGLYPFDNQIPGNAEDMVLHNKDAEIFLEKDGKFKIQKVGGPELVDLVSQLADLCSQIANSAGPTFNAASFTALKALVDEIKGA